MTRPSPRLEVEGGAGARGPLRLLMMGILVSFLIGVTIFVLVSRLKAGDPAPPPGEEFVPVSSP